MDIKIFPLLISCILLLIKCISLKHKFSIEDIFGWLTISLIWLWITWAYWKNKTLPSIHGGFQYKNGENNFIRSFYVAAITLLFSGIVIIDVRLLMVN
jgi:hypothetical protein